MSTIATTNIKEPSSATNNITLTSGGDTTISGNATISGTINNLTYPTADGTSGQVLKTDGSGTLSFASPFTYGTAHTFDNTTNEKTFTGIPSTAKRITVLIEDLSTASNLSSQLYMRVGPSTGILTTNIYTFATSYGTSTDNANPDSYYRVIHSNFSDPLNVWSGRITLTKLTASGNTWVVESQVGAVSGGAVNSAAGSIKLGSDVLERVQLLHGNLDNYDAGTVNIMYES